MNRAERLEFCAICQNRKFDLKKGLLCGITADYANFENSCNDFVEDTQEAERKMKLKLASVGNDIGHSTDFKKNQEQGRIIFIIGLSVTLLTHTFADALGFYIIAYGAVIWGAFQYFRGVDQEKKFKEEQEKKEIRDKISQKDQT